ncbi:hypothetical protein [Sorangium sp. So ce128]|uniref:hypothetical protein n=1 Tax=Sorangium sp. So ce128 TaxID=3133281 RepID=UPI003F6424C5
MVATGEYSAAGDRVMLRSAGAAPIVLGRHQDGLVRPGWEAFAPLTIEPSGRGEAESELLGNGGEE